MFEANSMTVSTLRKSGLLGPWKFRSYSDGNVPSFDVMLEIKDEEGKYTFNGRSVNFYFSSPKIDESKKTISVDAVENTKIAVIFEANQFEIAYYENLRNIERYELVEKNILIFYISKPTAETIYFERK